MKVLVAGAGLSGATVARLLAEAGHSILVLEQRESTGGNCADELHRPTGLMLHKYGPHGFHTNSDKVWNFVRRFATFNSFKLRVQGNVMVAGTMRQVKLPMKRSTMVGLGLEPSPENVKDLVFRSYSEKMWGVGWDKIPQEITSRVPTFREESDDTGWHLDKYQGVPIHGYTHMINCMLDHARITVGTSESNWRGRTASHDLLVYTGKLDEFFDFAYGPLPYRSLTIRTERRPQKQNCHQLNECNTERPWTRTVDQSYWYDQPIPNGSLVTVEYPMQHVHGQNDPFYPMEKFDGVAKKAGEYRAMAERMDNVLFVGRLATYRYLDMDMAVGLAMKAVEPLI